MTRRILLMSLLALSCATMPAVMENSDKLIVPGERVGPIKLGMTDTEFLALLGKPDKTWLYFGNPCFEYTGIGICTHADDHKVFDIDVKSPIFRTREGVGVGSRRFDLVLAKGNPDNQWMEGPKVVRVQYSLACYSFRIAGKTGDVPPEERISDTVQAVEIAPRFWDGNSVQLGQ